MSNSNGITPVGAVPACIPVIQRKLRQQQADNKDDKLSQGEQKPEEEHQSTDNNKKVGGLDFYA